MGPLLSRNPCFSLGMKIQKDVRHQPGVATRIVGMHVPGQFRRSKLISLCVRAAYGSGGPPQKVVKPPMGFFKEKAIKIPTRK